MRKQKPRRRKVHSVAFGFHDGSVISCSPERKPSERKIKEERIHICADGVFKEHRYSPAEWHNWELDQRVKAVTVLANRLNTRRAIRELVLPELEAIHSTLQDIQKKLSGLPNASRQVEDIQ